MVIGKKEGRCLNYYSARDFVIGKCGGPGGFLLWTAFWALWHITWFVIDLSVLTEKSTASYFRYLTNWGYILLLITSWVDFITSLLTYCCCKNEYELDKPTDEKTSKYIIPTWILFDTAKCTALEITIGYYVYLIWDGNVEEESPADLSSIIFHAFNTIYIILNLFVTSKPVGLCHWVFSVALALVYVIVSIILQFAFDIIPVYPGLNWREPWPNAIIFAFFVVLAPIAVHFAIYFIKKYLCQTRGRVEDVEQNEPTKEDLN